MSKKCGRVIGLLGRTRYGSNFSFKIFGGLKDGVIEGTKDYLMSYYDTVKNLSNLSFESVSNGVSSVWNIIKNPVEYINITNGNGGYSVKRNNTNVSVFTHGTTGYRIYGEKAGSSILQIRDSAGKVVSVSVVVRELPKITSYTHTPTVEEGYIGGFYFKIDKPNLVKEAGIEYFHTNSTNIIPRATDWKKQTLKVETDGEFGAFILPRSKINYVRGYIVTQSGNKIYTSTNGNIIASNVSLSDYYNLGGGQVIANVGEDGTSEDTEENENIGESYENEYIEDEEGVEVNAVPLVIIGVIAVFNAGMTIYDLYTTAQTCNNEGYFTINCGVEAGLSIIPIKGGKQAKNVLEFSGKSKKFGKDVRKIERLVHTNKTARETATKLGYTEVKDYPFNSHGSIVFKKGNQYITPDNTSHNYDYAWKIFNSKGIREGTAIIENGNLVIKKN